MIAVDRSFFYSDSGFDRFDRFWLKKASAIYIARVLRCVLLVFFGVFFRHFDGGKYSFCYGRS